MFIKKTKETSPLAYRTSYASQRKKKFSVLSYAVNIPAYPYVFVIVNYRGSFRRYLLIANGKFFSFLNFMSYLQTVNWQICSKNENFLNYLYGCERSQKISYCFLMKTKDLLREGKYMFPSMKKWVLRFVIVRDS